MPTRIALGLGVTDVMRAGVAAPFTPASISGLKLWFDANDAATLFQDDALTTPATADNDPIGGWKDKSGNGYHAIQATSGNKPFLGLALQNGKNVVRFGGNDRLIVSSLANGIFRNIGGGTLIAVVMDSSRTSGDSTHQAFLATVSGGTGSRISILTRLGGSATFTASGRRLDADALRSSTVASDDNFNILTNVSDWAGNAITLYKNGAAQTPNTYTSGAGNTSDTDSTTIGLGNPDNSTSAHLPGRIAEAIAYSKALSASELSSIHSYLSSKWGITLA